MSTIVEKVTDAVNDVTATLANASISDKKPDAAADKDKTAHQDAVLASAAEGRRLYIGNLAYATTEGELTTFFNGYLVESTSIPKNPRTERPVGYAFVDLSTPSEAERAISELSGKEILERKVSVQLARKPEAADEKRESPASGGEGGSGGEGVSRGEGRSRRTPGRGRGRGRARGGRAGRGARGSRGEDGQEKPADGVEKVADGEVLPLTELTNNQDTRDKEVKPPRQARERRERGPPADGIPSKTKIMVANLPYDLKEDKLKELFIDYEPSSAKIALRPIPHFMVKKLQARNEPRKGRGFGFVVLASEEQQQRAVSEMNGKEIEGREIAVKVAIDNPDKTDEGVNATQAETAINGTETTA